MYHFSNCFIPRNILTAIFITALGTTTPVFAQDTVTETVVELTSEGRFATTLQGIFADDGRDLADFANAT